MPTHITTADLVQDLLTNAGVITDPVTKARALTQALGRLTDLSGDYFDQVLVLARAAANALTDNEKQQAVEMLGEMVQYRYRRDTRGL